MPMSTDASMVAQARFDTICITGAGGFIASWIVKLLLERGYTIKGTVRDPEDPKNAHLWELEGAKERLTLCKADILDYESVKEAIKGCIGVFHCATPLSDDPERVLEPAVKGTKNVIKAAIEAKVARVVFTSTIGAVYMDPKRCPNGVVDENCWSDIDYCKETKNWYCYAKTIAEKEAWELAKEGGLDLVVVCPVVVLGPMLQPNVSASINHIHKYLSGSAKKYVNSVQAYVHVKDVAKAHVLLYEAPSASGRYICGESIFFHRGEVCEILAKQFPEYPVPTECSDKVNPKAKPYTFSNQKLKSIGMEGYISPKECIYETVKSLQDKGILPVLPEAAQLAKEPVPKRGSWFAIRNFLKNPIFRSLANQKVSPR